MKSRSAFTLLEVMFALLILASAMTIIFSTQFKALMRVWKGREDIDRIFLLKKNFYESYLQIPLDKKFFAKIKQRAIADFIQAPEVTISSNVTQISKKSELKEFRDSLKMLQTEGDWKSGVDTRQLRLVGFIFDEEEAE